MRYRMDGTTPEVQTNSTSRIFVAQVARLNRCIDSLEVRKKPGGHWIIRDLMGLDLVGLASL